MMKRKLRGENRSEKEWVEPHHAVDGVALHREERERRGGRAIKGSSSCRQVSLQPERNKLSPVPIGLRGLNNECSTDSAGLASYSSEGPW
jgi:hypothetical protein